MMMMALIVASAAIHALQALKVPLQVLPHTGGPSYSVDYIASQWTLHAAIIDHPGSCGGLQLETNAREQRRKPTALMTQFMNLINSKVRRRKMGRLLLVRHGESEMNSAGSFTGWVDSDITPDGRKEMEHAARLMLERGYTDVDVVYTSMLKRSIRSSWALLKELDQIFRPVKKSWMLNQRMYGALEGMAREDLQAEIGVDGIAEYRRSLFLKPPPMSEAHPRWHRDESKYRHVDSEDIPLTESIWDCFQRVRPLYLSCILPDLISGKNVLVVAHDHSLQGIIRCIDHLSDQAALDIVIPNGSPLVFQFGADQRPIPNADSFLPTSGAFLEDHRVLDMMIAKEKLWGNSSAASEHKGMYSLIDYSSSSLMTPIMRGLSKVTGQSSHKTTHPVDISSLIHPLTTAPGRARNTRELLSRRSERRLRDQLQSDLD